MSLINTFPTGSSGGASAVADLTDVNLSSLSDGQILKWDDTNDEWVNSDGDPTETVQMTKAEFDILPVATKNNGKAYFIPDMNIVDLDTINIVGFVPVGTVIFTIGSSAPQNYLLCDGTTYNIASYPKLSEYFRTQYGSVNHFGGNGTTTFAVPNLSSEYSQTDALYCIASENVYIEAREDYSLTEKVIGTWVDGKDLYQKVITGTTINSTSGTISTGLTGIDYCWLKDFVVSNGTYRKNLLDSVSLKNNGTDIAMVADSDSLFKNKTFYATVCYTKS